MHITRSNTVTHESLTRAYQLVSVLTRGVSPQRTVRWWTTLVLRGLGVAGVQEQRVSARQVVRLHAEVQGLRVSVQGSLM